MTTKESGLRGSIRNVGVGVGIPDSVLYQFREEDITVSDGTSGFTWPEREQSDDMAVSGATYDTSLFGGDGGVSSDGTDDNGQTSTMGSFGSSMDTDFAIAFRFSTTDQGDFLGENNSGSTTYLLIGNRGIRGSAGQLYWDLRDTNGDNIAVYSDTFVDDGGDYTVILNKTANSASGLEIYINDASTNEANAAADQSASSFADFDEPMTYFARNNSGSVSDYTQADWHAFQWFDSSLNESERQSVLDALS